MLTVDPILIRHALFNLLVNAAQADERRWRHRHHAWSGKTTRSGGAPGWSLAVTDHGRGMPPEVMDKIFVPFFTTRSDGTGLGLPVVQHVALLHDGQVTVSSEPGRGTRFAVWLPDSLPDSFPAPCPYPSIAIDMLPKILVVDDDRHTRILLDRLLAKTAPVSLAADGAEARQLFAVGGFQPGADGSAPAR